MLTRRQRYDYRDIDRRELKLIRVGHAIWSLYKQERARNGSTGCKCEASSRLIETISTPDSLKPFNEKLDWLSAFGKITKQATKSEIGKIVGASVAARDDMVNGGALNGDSRTAIPTAPAESTRQSKENRSIRTSNSSLLVFTNATHAAILAHNKEMESLLEACETVWELKRKLRADLKAERAAKFKAWRASGNG